MSKSLDSVWDAGTRLGCFTGEGRKMPLRPPFPATTGEAERSNGTMEKICAAIALVIRNLHTAFGDRPDVVEMVAALSQSFESLYKTEVLDLVQKFDSYLSN